MAFQVVEDRILTEAPSSMIVRSILLAITHIDIWKGTLEWRQFLLGYSSQWK